MSALQRVAYRTQVGQKNMNDQDQTKLDFSSPRMTAEERAVWAVLCMCRGRDMAILGPEIEQLTGIGYKRVQKVINDLRCHHAKLIGSGTFGYYMPQTVEEMDAVAHYIKDRAIKALVTWGRLKKLGEEEVLHQVQLDLKAAS